MVISIVTPSLNLGKTLPDLLASLRAQPFCSLEHVVFDGGSTDMSSEIWRGWEAENQARPTDKKHCPAFFADVNGERQSAPGSGSPVDNIDVRVFIEPDKGQSNAINKGMRIASGEVSSWLNADDVLIPGALRAVADAFEKYPSVVAVIGSGCKVDWDKNIRRKVHGAFNAARLKKAFEIVQPAMFFRRDAFWAVGGLDESLHYAMDWDLLLKLSKIGKVVAIPDHLANIRYYAETKTNTGGWKRMREIARIARRHNGILDRNYLSFHLRSLLARQPFRWPRVMFDHLCWNIFRDPPLMVQGWPEQAQS